MRLINADAIVGYIEMLNSKELSDSEMLDYLVKYIKNVPPTYDIDATIQRYEERVKSSKAKILGTKNTRIKDYYSGKVDTYIDEIDRLREVGKL